VYVHNHFPPLTDCGCRGGLICFVPGGTRRREARRERHPTPWKAKGRASAKAQNPRAAHKSRERTLGYKEKQNEKHIPRPAGLGMTAGEKSKRDSSTARPGGNRKARFPEETVRDAPPPQHAQGRRALGTPASLRMTPGGGTQTPPATSEKEIPRPGKLDTRKGGARCGPRLR